MWTRSSICRELALSAYSFVEVAVVGRNVSSRSYALSPSVALESSRINSALPFSLQNTANKKTKIGFSVEKFTRNRRAVVVVSARHLTLKRSVVARELVVVNRLC